MQKLKIINQFSTHTSVQFYLFFLLCSRFYMVLDGTPWSSSPMWEMDAIKVDMRLRSLQSVFWSLLNLNIYSIHNIHVHYYVKRFLKRKLNENILDHFQMPTDRNNLNFYTCLLSFQNFSSFPKHKIWSMWQLNSYASITSFSFASEFT